MPKTTRILVAVDFSPNSDRALKAAIWLAKKLDASVDLAHGFELPVPAMRTYNIAVLDKLMSEGRQAAQQSLDEECAKVQTEGVDCKGHVIQSPVPPAIAKLAEELECDLLVLGTRGHTGLKHVLLGSVAQRALHLAPCPVLVVK